MQEKRRSETRETKGDVGTHDVRETSCSFDLGWALLGFFVLVILVWPRFMIGGSVFSDRKATGSAGLRPGLVEFAVSLADHRRLISERKR